MTGTYQIDLDRTASTPVTEGIHTFEIVSGEEGEGAKGAYWRFNLRCLSPGEDGKTAQLIISLSPQARWRLEIFLDAIRAPEAGKATIENFFKRKLRAKVTHELYEGREQARLTDLFPAVPTAAATKVKAAPVVVKSVTRDLPEDVVEESDDDAIEFGT